MDVSESTKIVFNRIQKLEPDNAGKIIGYLLIQDNGDREMIRLAFGPDHLIHSLINKAKFELRLPSKAAVSSSLPSASMNSTPVSDHPAQYTPFRVGTPYWDPQVPTEQQLIHNMDFMPPVYPDTITDDYRLHNQQMLRLDEEPVNNMGSDFSGNYYYQVPPLSVRTSRRSPSMPEIPVKACHYFNKGFCKHGSNCRYIHADPMGDGFSQIFNSNNNDMGREEYVFSPGSLEKLEVELTELLRSRKGAPVSIAALPLLYYEKYGRALQAEGYLTESQRHGKAGYSLTKLLARLKNTIRLIDRPHGQHSVVLAEYAPNYNASNYNTSIYMDYQSERSDPGAASGSRQIYLTFPAESTFTEEDVSNYFKSFGPVQDVRIPTQQKRMFGFVTFIYPETVKLILAKGNPHFVCGARVLVKPYREKARLGDSRKYAEKMESPMYYPPQFLDMDSEFQSMRVCDHNSRLLQKQFIEEREQVIEFERMRLSEMHLASKPVTHQPYFGYSMGERKFPEEHNELPSADRFDYLLDVLNNGSAGEDKAKNSSNNFADQDSIQGINLPESPFASVATSLSTVI